MLEIATSVCVTGSISVGRGWAEVKQGIAHKSCFGHILALFHDPRPFEEGPTRDKLSTILGMCWVKLLRNKY